MNDSGGVHSFSTSPGALKSFSLRQAPSLHPLNVLDVSQTLLFEIDYSLKFETEGRKI